MQIAFDFSTLFSDDVQRLDKSTLLRYDPRRYWAVAKSIDALGQSSAKQQGLKRVITSYEKIVDQDDEQIVYLKWKKVDGSMSHLVGFLKVGYKKLYLTDNDLNQYEEKVLCILDFFVVADEQRKGHGYNIFETMLKSENVPISQCAFDRPSQALQQFLRKLYNLENPIGQNNKFVVFPDFFNGRLPTIVNTPQQSGRASRSHSTFSSRVSSRNGSPIMNRPRQGSVAQIMMHDASVNERPDVDPNTPTGRKNTRDFGHTRLW